MPRSWLRRRSTAQFTGITLVFLPAALWVALTAHAPTPSPAPTLSTPGSIVTTTPAEPPPWTAAPPAPVAATADGP